MPFRLNKIRQNGDRTFHYSLPAFTFILLAIVSWSTTANAQPSQSALADQLDQIYQERISAIEGMEITTLMVNGMLEGMETTTRYQKEIRDGRTVLVEIDRDEEQVGMDIADDLLIQMVRNASSVREESTGGSRYYRVDVDDPEYLTGLAVDGLEEEMDEELAIESATFYIDPEELVLSLATFRSGESGYPLDIHIEMGDYVSISGFPIPHTMKFTVEGLDQIISDDEMAEARRAMQEFEAQLESMPEAQRSMIESQLRPQMERFESMLEQGSLGEMEFQVTDVQVW